MIFLGAVRVNTNSTKAVFGLNINTTFMWDGFEHTDSDTGIYYLDSKNNSGFTNISIYLTNLQNDLVWSLDATVGGSGYCGRGYYESDWIKGNPDLAGYSIDFIRLVIHNLSIKQYDGGTQYISNKTWEFWGHSTPTPTASITNLTNVSFAQNYINWTWKDPLDTDFYKVMV